MKHLLFSILATLLLAGCANSRSTQRNLQEATPLPQFVVNPAPISDFVYDPAQQTITVYGDLVDGCTQFKSIAGEHDGNSITIDVLVSRESNRDCIQALEPFEAVYQLDATLQGGTYTVRVNDMAREITIEK